MFPSGFTGFDINNLPGLHNDGYCDDFGFNGPDWNVAGPSQPYTGVDVRGDLINYPAFPSPSTVPISLYPSHGAWPNEGYNSPFYQGSAMPSFSPQQATTSLPPSIQPSFPAPSPVPTFSCGSSSLSLEKHAAPIPIPNSENFAFDFSTATGSLSLPAALPSPTYIPSFEELWGQYTQSDLLHFGAPPFHPVADVTPPEPLPAPVASSSGPRRTRRPAREGRRYDPVKSAKKAELKKGDWNQTLVRFRAKLDTLYSVRNGQPSGGLEPAMALAEMDKFVKEDLKRSPLGNTKAGEGRRSRDVEEYLKGLLRAICPAEPTPILAGVASNEDDTAVAALSRLADELEGKLAVVNQRPALRQSANTSKHGQKTSVGGEQTEGHPKKNELEKARRDSERHHLDRISRLFKAAQHQWSKKDVLGLAVLFLLCGPRVLPHDFVEVRSTVPGL